jgi:nucleoside-diphosphate kinase
MSNGPLEVIAFEGEDAVQKWREIMGPTRIEVRKTHPHTLRGMFSRSDTKNILHGSDSTVNAATEIDFFFPEFKYQSDFDKRQEC